MNIFSKVVGRAWKAATATVAEIARDEAEAVGTVDGGATADASMYSASVVEAMEESMEAEWRVKLENANVRLAQVLRINGEYFDLIVQMEKERDEWKEMFFKQAGEHQNGQSLLQNKLSETAQVAKKAVAQLNVFRQAAGFPLVTEPKMLGELPQAIPEDYGARMKAIADGAMPQTDGKAERAKIAATMLSDAMPDGSVDVKA